MTLAQTLHLPHIDTKKVVHTYIHRHLVSSQVQTSPIKKLKKAGHWPKNTSQHKNVCRLCNFSIRKIFLFVQSTVRLCPWQKKRRLITHTSNMNEGGAVGWQTDSNARPGTNRSSLRKWWNQERHLQPCPQLCAKEELHWWIKLGWTYRGGQ